MLVTSFAPQSAINVSHRKEKYFKEEYAVIAFRDGEFINPVSLRFYKTPSNRHYACVWVYNSIGNASGSASDNAKGYNYNKQAEAAHRAFKSAGIEFDTEVSSYNHFKPALEALAKHLGFNQFTVFNAAG